MQHQNLTKYAAYIKEKIGAELIEWENAWATYFIDHDYLFICDFYVDPLFRKKNVGTEMLVALSQIAKNNECKTIRSSVMTNSNDCTGALHAQLARGFKVCGAASDKIFLVKEL